MRVLTYLYGHTLVGALVRLQDLVSKKGGGERVSLFKKIGLQFVIRACISSVEETAHWTKSSYESRPPCFKGLFLQSMFARFQKHCSPSNINTKAGLCDGALRSVVAP